MTNDADFSELSNFKLDPASVRLLDYQYCLDQDVVILNKVAAGSSDAVAVGLLDPSDSALIQTVSMRLGRPVAPVQLNAYEIRRAIDLGFEKTSPEGLQRLRLRHAAKPSFKENAPVAETLTQILAQAVSMGASDVHIESFEADVDVRFRIDGVLRQIPSPFHVENIHTVVARLKVLSNLDIAEKRQVQDGRILAAFEQDGQSRTIDFRLSIVPGPFGEDAVLRVLDSERPVVPLTDLGLPKNLLSQFERLVQSPEGMILVTGPTGSGKTTTLYSALQCFDRTEKKILTVEDPIEYSFPKICQKQITEQLGYAAYARAFMRQNPDIILVGEIRDAETAQAAIRAAQTGHLVLSTLHTNNAVQSVIRLQTLGIEPNTVASTVLGILAQRLVRRICGGCRAETRPSDREKTYLRISDGPYFTGKGCDKCSGKGYKGRVGIYELFLFTDEIQNMIAQEKPNFEIRARARADGFRSLYDDALDKARNGMTTLSELIRVLPYRLIHESDGH